MSPDFTFHQIRRREPCGLIKPAGQHDAGRQISRLARQNDENGLRNFLSMVGIAGEAQRGGRNKVHMARDERGKSRPGFGAGKLGKQRVIIRFWHLPNDVRKRQNWTKNFSVQTMEHALTLLRISI